MEPEPVTEWSLSACCSVPYIGGVGGPLFPHSRSLLPWGAMPPGVILNLLCDPVGPKTADGVLLCSLDSPRRLGFDWACTPCRSPATTKRRCAPSPQPTGTYKVIWRVLSVDTHTTEGDFKLTVAP